MKKSTILKDMYVQNTMNDGQKFCGCREGDCSDYHKKTACRKCLDNLLAEKQNEQK